MRSTVKDQSRMVRLHGIVHVLGGGDQTGHFSDGTPWRSVRASVGQYDIFFDPRLIPMNGAIGEVEQARQFFWMTQLLPGLVHVRCMLHDGTQTDANFDLNINFIDTRS